MLEIVTENEKPEYATKMSAGFDIRADLSDSQVPWSCPRGYRMVVPTGLRIKFKPTWLTRLAGLVGFVPQLEIRPRSGLAAKAGVTVLNSPGTIDADYPDEIMVILINHDPAALLQVRHGDRIAQGVFTWAYRPKSLKVKQQVRTGGLGSTGK